MAGYIPNEVHFYARPEQTVKRVPSWKTHQQHMVAVTCRPAFPVSGRSPEDSKTRENAIFWSAGYRWPRWEAKQAKTRPDAKPSVVKNTPKRGYRLVGAESRGEGGRAWLVVTPEGYLVDMREDVFLPILLDRGLPADGIIDAEFQWCQEGSQLRLEEVGSPGHKEYLPEDVRYGKTENPTQPLKAKDLRIGGVYRALRSLRVYVGRVRHKGKLVFAWIEFDPCPPEQFQDKTNTTWTLAPVKREITVSSSPQVFEHLGDVTIPDVKTETRAWQTSQGWYIHEKEFSWP